MDFFNINLAAPTWDLFIILFFVVAAFLYGLSLGRNRVIIILISIYISLAIVKTAPYLDGFSTEVSLNNSSVFQVTVFVGLFVVLFFLLTRGALMRTIAAKNSQGVWYQSILFSFFQCGLMLSIILSYLPQEMLNDHVSKNMQSLFISDPAMFFWLVAPILVMVVIRKKKEED